MYRLQRCMLVKISKKQLKRIIKEEKAMLIKEMISGGRGGGLGNLVDQMEGLIDDAMLAQTQDEYWYDKEEHMQQVASWIEDLQSRFNFSSVPN
jgi:hypothetical protein